jgi:hypothetical protein
MPPPQPQQPQQQKNPIDIQQLMRIYDPKQLQSLAQGLQGLLKVQAAMQPRPDPRQQLMQPGPMQQLAMLDLQRRQAEFMQKRQQAGMPVPQ